MSRPSAASRAAVLLTDGLAFDEHGQICPTFLPDAFRRVDEMSNAERSRFVVIWIAWEIVFGRQKGPVARIAKAHCIEPATLRAAVRTAARKAGFGFALRHKEWSAAK